MAEVLVTGAGGFIGAQLVEFLAGRHRVRGLGRGAGDIAEASTWAGVPDARIVVHLAARSFVPASWDDPQGFIHTNLTGTTLALDFCRKHKARFVFVSSYVYGAPDVLPIPETAPLRAANPYALSKLLAEEACRFYAESFDVPVTILRPFNIFGPGQNASFLIPSIARQALEADEIVVKDLEPRRDYVFVADFIAAVAAALERPQALGVFNIGSGGSHSVAEVVECVSRAAGRRPPIRSEGQRRPNEIMDVRADISRAHDVLGWEPVWSFEQGCAAVVKHLQAGRSMQQGVS